MAVFKKLVNKAIPELERLQTFTSSDVSSGDILDIVKSLGSPAAGISIFTSDSSDLSIRFNALQEIYPERDLGDGLGTALDGPSKLLGSVETYIDQTVGSIPIGGDNEKAMHFSGPIKNIEVTWSTGTWTLVVYTTNKRKINQVLSTSGLPVTLGLTGWWSSTNIDGSENSTLTDGDRVDTWVDQSGNGYDLTAIGNVRPYYEDSDNSGDSPSYPIVDFYETGPEEHFMTRSGTDFETILPSDGKSTYVVLYFEENTGSYGGGSNKGLAPRLVSGSHYPIRWGLEYARYSDGGANWDVVFVQDDTIIDSVKIGTGVNQPINNGRFIFSFRQDGYSAGTDNYFLSCYNANAAFTNSTQGEVANTPDCNLFRVRFTYIPEDMEYYEVITFNRKLTDEEDAAMVAYLNTKWGVGASL